MLSLFSNSEKVGWTKKVNSYVSVVTNQLKKENIYYHLYLYECGWPVKPVKIRGLIKNKKKEYEKVSYLHTGSIPSKFAKPLMILGDISQSIVRSHLEIASDHDVMLVLNNMPVVEVMGKILIDLSTLIFKLYSLDDIKKEDLIHLLDDKNQAGIWLRASIVNNNEEFVYLSVCDGLDVNFRIRNSFSSDFLKEIISKELLLKNIPLEIRSSNLGEFLRRKMDGESKVIIGKAGPSLNLKITTPDGIIIFDCDFLLSFPLVKWPSPAQARILCGEP